jgi:hypothetical protein
VAKLFRETGSIKRKSESGRSTKCTLGTVENVRQVMNDDPYVIKKTFTISGFIIQHMSEICYERPDVALQNAGVPKASPTRL